MSFIEITSYFMWEIIVGLIFGILFSSILFIITLGKIGKLGKVLFEEYKPLLIVYPFLICFGLYYFTPALLDIVNKDIVSKEVFVSENFHQSGKRYYLKADGKTFYYDKGFKRFFKIKPGMKYKLIVFRRTKILIDFKNE